MTNSKLLGTVAQRRKMYDDAPASHKLTSATRTKRNHRPPYDGPGNLALYVRRIVAPIKGSVYTRNDIREVVRIVNKFYDFHGAPPQPEEIALYAPIIVQRMHERVNR